MYDASAGYVLGNANTDLVWFGGERRRKAIAKCLRLLKVGGRSERSKEGRVVKETTNDDVSFETLQAKQAEIQNQK